ncbi:MAG: pyridoxal-phosphate dependent enzyme [Lachnospiraceae bacterium]|nr:pyridoxal-phosphate dependent enzyme [Lachnospiraceae bacterium]
MKIAKNMAELVGNTPMLEIVNYNKMNDLKAKLVVKLEMFNPMGSAKDRVALNMIENALERGDINKDTVII